MRTLLTSTLKMFVASSLTLLAFYAINASAQSAWTPAPANAPSGNVAGPLTTGATGQSKAGNLMLNTDGTLANGLIVANGNVGIGVLNPDYLLDINGTFAAKYNLDMKSGISQIAWNRDSRTGSIYDSAHHAWQLGPTSVSNDGFSIKHFSPSGTYSGGVIFSVDDNVGVGTQTPNVSKGAGGYVDAKDVYLRDAGKWASQVGGGSGSIVAGCTSKSPTGIESTWIDPSIYNFYNCFGGASGKVKSNGGWGGAPLVTASMTCPTGSTVQATGLFPISYQADGYSNPSSGALTAFLCLKS